MEYEYKYLKFLINYKINGFNIDKFYRRFKKYVDTKIKFRNTRVTYNVLRTNSMENLKEISKILISMQIQILLLYKKYRKIFIII